MSMTVEHEARQYREAVLSKLDRMLVLLEMLVNQHVVAPRADVSTEPESEDT